MAAKITHLEIFKQAVIHLEHGDDKQKRLARMLQNQELARFAALGTTAPDVFYYYHLFSGKNKLAEPWGNFAHHSRVLELVLEFLEQIRDQENETVREKQLSFAMGYISHCVVDVITHPYIFYFTGDYYSSDDYEAAEAQANHLRIEYALDAYLVNHRWGLHPHQYNYIQYIDCREKFHQKGKRHLDYDIWSLWVRALATVFPREFQEQYYGSTERIVKGDIINESYLGFYKFSRLSDIRWLGIRFLLRTLDLATLHKLKASYLILPPREKISHRITNEKHKTWKYPADPERTSKEDFMELIHRAARNAARCMTEGLEFLEGKRKRKDLEKEYAGFNLDTGLRSESL